MRSMMVAGALAALASAAQVPGAAATEACPGNPDALGVSRVITVDPKAYPFLGTLQYKQTLPLEKGEVVLTFDDGPLPPMTNRVLDALAHECVKATFFSVGKMASTFPHVLQRVHAEGHTIGSHSQTHPLIFPKLKQPAGIAEIETGFQSVNGALAPVGAHAAPYFRFPGLGRTKFYEAYTQEHGLAVFSVDAVADDWMHLKPEEVEKRALDRLTARGGGILLLHDIQPSTAVMLPDLLRQLKARGFRIVQVVYPGDAQVAAPAEPKPAGPTATSAAVPPPVADTPAVTPAAAASTAAATTSGGALPAPLATTPAAEVAGSTARALPEPADTPFTLFWPRVMTDALPKGLR